MRLAAGRRDVVPKLTIHYQWFCQFSLSRNGSLVLTYVQAGTILFKSLSNPDSHCDKPSPLFRPARLIKLREGVWHPCRLLILDPKSGQLILGFVQDICVYSQILPKREEHRHKDSRCPANKAKYKASTVNKGSNKSNNHQDLNMRNLEETSCEPFCNLMHTGSSFSARWVSTCRKADQLHAMVTTISVHAG